MRTVWLGVLVAMLSIGSLLPGCGGESCGEGKSLEIIAPSNGDSVNGVAVDVTVLACGFDRDEAVILYLLNPVETAYANLRVEDSEVLSVTVPTLPGEMQFQAGARDEDAVRSAIISIDATR